MLDEEQTYTQEEAEGILRIAAQRSLSDRTALDRLDGIRHAELEQTAAEIGISPSALASAEAEFILAKADEEIRDEDAQLRRRFQVARKASLLGDLAVYVGLNVVLLALYSVLTPYMFFWPAVAILLTILRLAPTLHRFGSRAETEKQYAAWSVSHWGSAMAATDYWRSRTGGAGANVPQNGQANIHQLIALREADREFLRNAATSGVTTKIEAMRRLREATGMGLGTAKAVVDDYAHRNPGSFQ